ncbi:MAG: putative sulfate exporter family transporter [Acidimicrobiales bacterium]
MAAIRSVAPGLGLVVALSVLATVIADQVDAVSPLVAGVVLGALVVNATALPAGLQPGVVFAAKQLLRLGIVLLGFRLSLGDLGELGLRGLVVVAMVVACTFFGTQWLGARMGLSKDLSLLVATGYSICGASAVAAMDGVIEADEEETAYAVALVTLCGSLSIGVLPLIGHLLGLEGATFGTWVGAAVHDVAQVVATASTDGPAALEAATVVKLTRVVLLAPLVALVALRRRRNHVGSAIEGDAVASHPPIVPLFVAGFLGAVLVRSSGVLSSESLAGIKDAEKVLLTLALVGLGMGVRLDRLRRLGGRPLVLGLVAWLMVAGVALAGVGIINA